MNKNLTDMFRLNLIQKRDSRLRENDNIFLTPDQPILIAVSGGADSVCLTHLLWSAQKFPLILAHFNHQLRGRQSQKDVNFVQNFARKLDLPLEIGVWENPTKSETKARAARYQFLRRMQKKYQAQAIALAHHQDDQVETILLNLVRGAGLKGLCGMSVFADDLWRPLLNFTKQEILAYCQKNHLQFCTDQSNFDTEFQRNLLRLEILPRLKRINHGLNQTLTQNAQIFETIQNYLSAQIAPLRKKNTIKLSVFLKLHPALQNELIKQKLAPFSESSFVKIQEILNLIQAQKTGKWKQFGKLRVYLESGQIIFKHTEKTEQQAPAPQQIQIGTLQHWGDWKIKTQITGNLKPSKKAIYLNADRIQERLILRAWQKGDFFLPQGMAGRQKIADLFINQKIPRAARNQIPLLVDQQGQILLIGNFRYSRLAAPSSSTKKYLKIIWEKSV